jgi:hypothetical protein
MKKTNKKENYHVITFIFSIILIGLPAFILRDQEFWDGIIFAYAYEIKDFSGIKFFLFQASWHLQYFLSKILLEISYLLKFHYKYIFLLVSFISIFLCAIEVKLICDKILKIKNELIISCSLFFLSFPIWHIIHSSIFVIHFLCIWFVLYGVRRYHSNKKLSGLIFITLSTFLQTNLLFSIVLSSLYDCTNNKILKFSNFKKTFYVCILNICIFFFLRFFLEPYGLWQGHNSIKNPFIDLYWFKMLIINILNYSSFFFYSLFFFSICFILPLFTLNLGYKNFILTKKNLIINYILFFLCLASIIPILAAGKSSNIFDFNWDSRHALLLPVSLTLLIFYNLNFLFIKINLKYYLKFIILIMIFFNCIMTFYSHITIYNYSVFRNDLEIFLKGKKFNSGNVHIFADKLPMPVMISLESNYVFWKAFKRQNWQTFITDDKNFFFHSGKNFDYNKQFINKEDKIWNGSIDYQYNCLTSVTLVVEGYTRRTDMINNSLNIIKLNNSNKKIKLLSSRKNCLN